MQTLINFDNSPRFWNIFCRPSCLNARTEDVEISSHQKENWMTTDQALRDPEHGPRRATLTARPKIVQRFAWSVTGRARAV